jgi:ABC-type phosphate/phosphonate transport system ATPase subunit
MELKRKDALEIKAETQQQKHIKLIGSQLRNKSHVLWSFNTVSKELKAAIYNTGGDTLYLDSFDLDSVRKAIGRFYSKVVVEQDCVYFQALNEANAIKKLNKQGLL